MKIYTKQFWQDRQAWKRASYNTMHCLIGCSIGDFGMLIYLQINYPKLALVWMMILPMITGIITSLSLETVVLKLKEKLSWAQSLSTAFNMSIMSMIAMEFSENTTDFILTGRTVPVSDSWYWVALGIALCVGFLVPLPYNYFKLKYYKKGCH